MCARCGEASRPWEGQVSLDDLNALEHESSDGREDRVDGLEGADRALQIGDIAGADVIAATGDVLEPLQAGDVLLVRSRESEAFDAVAVVASPEVVERGALPELERRPIGRGAGLYVQVVESGQLPKPSSARGARRVADATGRVVPGITILRREAQACPASGQGKLAAEDAYAPKGARTPRPVRGPLRCTPRTPQPAVATQLPEKAESPESVLASALTGFGVTAAQVRRIDTRALTPIARAFGAAGFAELLARLRWSPGFLFRHRDKLVPRLLIHIPGHFRDLARRAPHAREAHALESLGWLIMEQLRDEVAAASKDRWWVPASPAFVTAFPNPLPGVSPQVIGLILGRGLIHTTMPQRDYEAAFQRWSGSLAGRQWRLEVEGARPGRLFYPELVTIPAHRSTARDRAVFRRAFAARVADADRAYPTRSKTELSLNGLRKTAALRRCDNRNTHLPRSSWQSVGLAGLELVPGSLFPQRIRSGRRPTVVRTLPVLGVLQPVFAAVFQTLSELGWNDLVYTTAGAGCFRGTKLHPGQYFRDPDNVTVARLGSASEREKGRVRRAMSAARRMSNHGLGAAIDVNVFENDRTRGRPFGSLDPRVVALFEAFGFRWGACFSQPDPMHFEYCENVGPPPTPPDGPFDEELGFDEELTPYVILDGDPSLDGPLDEDLCEELGDEPGEEVGEELVRSTEADEDLFPAADSSFRERSPPLPPDTVSSDPGDQAGAEMTLAPGCWAFRFTPTSSKARATFDGTLRVERAGASLVVSGDAYVRPRDAGERGPTDGGQDTRRPTEGPEPVPIFPRDRYAGYLRLVAARPLPVGIRLELETWPYDHSRGAWQGPSVRTVELQPVGAGGSRDASAHRGSVFSERGETIGELSLRWVSPYLRRAVVEVDRVGAAEAPLGDLEGRDWRSVFGEVGWDVTVTDSDADVVEPSGPSWSAAELHAAMLERRDRSTDLDQEWAYHLLCVRNLDLTARGLMYDASASDSNNVPREGAVVASHWTIPSGADRSACGKPWGRVAGKRFGAAAAPYFRTAVHEISHAMGLGHPHGDDRGHIMLGTNGIVCRATSTWPFPDNIEWTHSPADQRRLKHLPDHWVRPGAHVVRFAEGSATYAGAPAALDHDRSVDVVLSVQPLLDVVPLGAPVRVTVTLENRSHDDITVPTDFSLKAGVLSGHVLHPDGGRRTFRSLFECTDSAPVFRILRPGESLRRSETLLRGGEGALFEQAGEYHIDVVARWVVDGRPLLARGSGKVSVAEPSNEAHTAIAKRLLSTPDTHLVLALGGDHLSDGVAALEVALGDEVLRPHFAFIEAKRRARPFFGRPRDDTASDLLDETTVLSACEARRAEELRLSDTAASSQMVLSR